MRKMIEEIDSWVGLHPAEWGENKIKHIATIHNKHATSNQGYIGLENIEGWTGRFLPSDISADGESVAFEKDDVLFGKLRPYLAKTFLAPSQGCGSTELMVMRSTGINPKYLSYIFRSKTLIDCIDQSTYGAKMPRASADFIKNLKVPIPDECEQKEIVEFLDKKCEIIDSLIKNHRRSITALKENIKDSTIYYVTKGVHNADLGPSGEEWLGDIPKHWKIQRNRTLFKETNERGNDQLPILMVSINSGISDKEIPDEERTRSVKRSEDKSKYKRMLPGDLVYNMMRAWQGAFGAARVEGMVSPAYVTLRPIVDLDSRYYEYLMRTDIAAQEFKKYSRGIKDFRLRLYYPEFRDIKVCAPPVEEQREIADYLDRLYEQTETAIKQKQLLIEKLEEYRKSIIYHAVTGKIDCREVLE